MNAPAAAGIANTYEQLPLASIVRSTTITQERRRRRFDAKLMAELVESVRQVGVIEPVLVVPHPDPGPHARYELVAGERRWLAAQEAGLGHIPAVIANIERDELVLFQVIENKHRETLHPLDEAEAYNELMKGKGFDAERVGELAAVSRAHVYNRLKLLKLVPEALAALEAGEIDHTHALRLARIPLPKLQKKALKIAIQPNWRGEKVSERELGDKLRGAFMVRLDSVPFAIDDATLKPERGACTDCPHFSANDPELHAEVVGAHGEGAKLCTDKPCHDNKVHLAFGRRIDNARKDGRRVVESHAAKEIKPDRHMISLKGYVDLDEQCDQVEMPDNAPDDWQPPTYRELIGDAVDKPTLLVDPHNGQPRDIVEEAEAKKLLKKRGIEYRIHKPLQQAAEERRDPEAARVETEKREARENLERAVRARLLTLVHGKWKGALKREELERVADILTDSAEISPQFDELYPEGTTFSRMNEGELARYIAVLLLSQCCYLGNSPAPLLLAAKRLRIDAAKVRKQAKAEQS